MTVSSESTSTRTCFTDVTRLPVDFIQWFSYNYTMLLTASQPGLELKLHTSTLQAHSQLSGLPPDDLLLEELRDVLRSAVAEAARRFYERFPEAPPSVDVHIL